MAEHLDLLAWLGGRHELPAGTDRWGIRIAASRHGFVWPKAGWAQAPGPLLDHRGDAPLAVGDGICLAHTWAGMASTQAPAARLLLVAYAGADALGPLGQDAVRVRRAYVVAELDGLALIRQDALGADLRRANLVRCALAGACLFGADLSYASLAHADLRGASLAGADLSGADLRHANLSGANLAHASLRQANLGHANLVGVSLVGADLHGLHGPGADIFAARFR